MFAKIAGALPGYVYAEDADGVYVNLFVGSTGATEIGGIPVRIKQKTRYPWKGKSGSRSNRSAQ